MLISISVLYSLWLLMNASKFGQYLFMFISAAVLILSIYLLTTEYMALTIKSLACSGIAFIIFFIRSERAMRLREEKRKFAKIL